MPAQPPGQPVVREADGARYGRRRSGSWSRASAAWSTVNDATGTEPDRVGPRRRAAELGDQLARRRRAGPGVVPQQRGADHRTRTRRGTTMPCCWPPTEIGRDVVEAAGGADRRLEAPSTRPRAATSVPSGWGARPSRTTTPGVGVDDDDLAGLRRGVDPATSAMSADAVQVLEGELVEVLEAHAALGRPRRGRTPRRGGRRGSRRRPGSATASWSTRAAAGPPAPRGRRGRRGPSRAGSGSCACSRRPRPRRRPCPRCAAA